MMKTTWMKRLGPGLGLVCACAVSTGSLRAQVAGGGAARTTRSTTTYPASTEVGEAMISVDTETRNLIVITDDETAEQIKGVVASLDRSPPQVLINVVFLEVNHRKGMDLGVDMSYSRNFGEGDEYSGSASQTFRNLAGLITGGSGGLYSIAGSEFEVTLRALAQEGRLEVLSRPTILARNNQQAVITVGQRVPLVNSVRYDTFGNQINGVAYENVGIILQVTPFITSENMVEMVVAPEISALAEQSVNISTGTNAVSQPIINIRSADTVVVTPDGQTVVIGGLISNNHVETKNKVPFLGDIPLLGALFRRTVQSSEKTELLIFLTPHIIRTPAQLAQVTASHAGQTELVTEAYSEQELNRFFESEPPPEIGPPTDDPRFGPVPPPSRAP